MTFYHLHKRVRVFAQQIVESILVVHNSINLTNVGGQHEEEKTKRNSPHLVIEETDYSLILQHKRRLFEGKI